MEGNEIAVRTCKVRIPLLYGWMQDVSNEQKINKRGDNICMSPKTESDVAFAKLVEIDGLSTKVIMSMCLFSVIGVGS